MVKEFWTILDLQRRAPAKKPVESALTKHRKYVARLAQKLKAHVLVTTDVAARAARIRALARRQRRSVLQGRGGGVTWGASCPRRNEGNKPGKLETTHGSKRTSLSGSPRDIMPSESAKPNDVPVRPQPHRLEAREASHKPGDLGDETLKDHLGPPPGPEGSRNPGTASELTRPIPRQARLDPSALQASVAAFVSCLLDKKQAPTASEQNILDACAAASLDSAPPQALTSKAAWPRGSHVDSHNGTTPVTWPPYPMAEGDHEGTSDGVDPTTGADPRLGVTREHSPRQGRLEKVFSKASGGTKAPPAWALTEEKAQSQEEAEEADILGFVGALDPDLEVCDLDLDLASASESLGTLQVAKGTSGMVAGRSNVADGSKPTPGEDQHVCQPFSLERLPHEQSESMQSRFFTAFRSVPLAPLKV
eukprot:jgi/Botrbrau1/19556/Bobra.0035s0048.1